MQNCQYIWTKRDVHRPDVATQISTQNVWQKWINGIGSTCEAKDATKEMERGTILCTNFILLNQQVVLVDLVSVVVCFVTRR